MVSSLLQKALEPSHYYWFEMYHAPTIKHQMSHEEERHGLNPAIAFSLMAIALRKRTSDGASTYGHGDGDVTLIPNEVISPPRGPNDLSERLKKEAEKYLDQAILTADKATGSWLQIAQAATILMQLEMELSPPYMRFLYLAAIFFRAPSLQIALDQEAKATVGIKFQSGPLMRSPNSRDVKRGSITMESAARLRLLPLWVGSRVGVAFPNIEFHQTHFKEEDILQAYAFAPWSDEEDRTGESKDDYANSLRSRIVGLSILSTGLGARFMPYGLNYADPPEALQKCLRILDDSEFVLDLSREVIDFEEKSYYRLAMIRLVTSVVHMHGIVIRRCNLAHCDALRQTLVANLGGKDGIEGKSGSTSKPMKFTSPALDLWCEVMQVFITEFDTDHLVYTTTSDSNTINNDGNSTGSRLHISRYQIDVVRLYVAATFQLRGGIINTLQLVGVDRPMEDELVQNLSNVAEKLQDCILRHVRLMDENEKRQRGHQFTSISDLPLAHPHADYHPIGSALASRPPNVRW
jgi:hypothetical protein